MSLNLEEKITRQRLSVLELAEALGNVSEACRQRGVSRTQFYEYKRRFQTHGLAGLKDLPPIPHSHPNTTPDEVVAQILDLSLAHPAWGCNRLSDHLKLAGVNVSGQTIQTILNRHELGTRYHRWLKLELDHSQASIVLTGEQIAFIEKQNPIFRERHVESGRPGELLNQDTFQVGTLKGIGKVYLHAIVDTFSSFAFGFLHTSKQPEAAVAVLHNEALPFYDTHSLAVGAVLTDNGREFCGTERHPYEIYLDLNEIEHRRTRVRRPQTNSFVERHPYEIYLDLNEIEHRRTRVRRPQTNGFVERFNRTILDEFFHVAFRTTFYESLERLQADLDQWLKEYNYERPHQGYRNMGRRPFDTIQEWLDQQSAAADLVPEPVRDVR